MGLEQHANLIEQHEELVDQITALERKRILELLWEKAKEVDSVRIYNFLHAAVNEIDPEGLTRKQS